MLDRSCSPHLSGATLCIPLTGAVVAGTTDWTVHTRTPHGGFRVAFSVPSTIWILSTDLLALDVTQSDLMRIGRVGVVTASNQELIR